MFVNSMGDADNCMSNLDNELDENSDKTMNQLEINSNVASQQEKQVEDDALFNGALKQNIDMTSENGIVCEDTADGGSIDNTPYEQTAEVALLMQKNKETLSAGNWYVILNNAQIMNVSSAKDSACEMLVEPESMNSAGTTRMEGDAEGNAANMLNTVQTDHTSIRVNCPQKKSRKTDLRCGFPGCNRDFDWPAHLNYHLLTHTGERYYKCAVDGCEKSFYTAQRLRVHMRTHTGEKPFRCSEDGCDKTFSTAGNLKNHIRTHTGEKPFACTEENCHKKFAEYSSLRKHKLVHSGKKPFECSFCGKSFSQSGSRNVHIKSSHSESIKQLHAASSAEMFTSSHASTEYNDEDHGLVMNTDDPQMHHYQDVHNDGEPSVFQPVNDHNVTVTTQSSDKECDKLDLLPGILPSIEVTRDVCLRTSLRGANVLVLSQPQEIVTMGTSYRVGQTAREALPYENLDLLNSSQ